jgi:hypothetical protein
MKPNNKYIYFLNESVEFQEIEVYSEERGCWKVVFDDIGGGEGPTTAPH